MRSIVALLLIAGAGFGQEFEAVSIRPNASGTFDSHSRSDQGLLTGTNLTLRSLILTAYAVKDYQVEGPDWLGSARFDISARFPPDLPHDREQYAAAMGTMMRKMLEDRFKLAIHREQKMFPVYGLFVEKSGIKFKQVPEGPSHSNSHNNHYEGGAVSMARFAEFLSGRSDMPMLDMTGLKGFYDLTLDWFPEAKPGEIPAGPALPEALEEQLGLKLENRKAPVEVVVVDHAEKTPSEN